MRSLLGRFHRPNARSQSEQLFMLNNLGDGSTLSLDFTTGVLDPRLTFTRSTTGTYINNSGYVTSAAINAPRFDYDPITRTPRGLLIEGSSINYMLESTSLSGYSNTNMVAVTSGTETDPEGNANSAKQIYATSGALAYHGFFRSTTAGTNTQITVSIWAKARNYTFLFLSDLATGRASVRFNLNTGATDNNFGAGFVSAKATPFPNNWWRCEMVVNVTASTAYAWAFGGTPSGATLNGFGTQYAGTGNAADGIYCYGFQVEAGSGASSYIPTVASTGSRAADVCNMTGTNFSSWFTLGPGTVLVHQDFTKNNTRNLAATISNGGTTYIEMGYRAVGFSTEAIGYNNAGALTFTSTAFTPTINTAYKSAYVWEPGATQLNVCANGTLGTAASSPVTGAMDRLVLGADGTSPTDSYIKNGHIRSLKYWPTRLPNAQLQALTT